jgi:peptide/nickel transport system substrate-binding protein
VTIGAGSVWVGNGEAAVAQVAPGSNAVRATVDVGNDPAAIAVGAGAVWVADGVDNTVTRIDPKSADAITRTIPVGEGPSAIAVGASGVWVANSQDDTVARIAPSTGSVTATIPVGGDPTGIAVGGGSVWVANSASGTVTRLDPVTNDVTEIVEVGQAPQSVTVANGQLWVSVDASSPAAPAVEAAGGGNVLRVLLAGDPGDLDPAQAGPDVQRAYETCARLYNYPDRPAPQGERLKPEVARGPPIVTDGGRTYTFRIRRGFRFSPPSNEPVTASAFERAIERDLNPRTNSYASTLMGDIAGARGYIAGRTSRLTGVGAHGDRLVVRLIRPAPDLVDRLSTLWLCAVPPGTPLRTPRAQVIPSAGPYYVASYVPNKSIVLRRNPNYGGSRPRRFAEIDYEIGVAPAKAISEVQAGQADYYGNEVPGDAIPLRAQATLASQYGPASVAARSGREQYFVEPYPSVFSLVFNTHRPPFDNPRLRRAVNFALDRRALAGEPFPQVTGRPTDQYIPPGVPGFHDWQIYPLGGPDLKKARRLAGGVHRRVVLYTCNQAPCAQFGQIVSKDLAAIGLHVEVRQFAISTMFARETAPGGGHFNLGEWNQFADFPDPADFINQQFDPRSALISLFDDPSFERRIRAAAQVSGPRRDRVYARVDRELAGRAAPEAAYASGTTISFFSPRVGCQVDQPIYGIDLGRLCLRQRP